MPVESPRSRSTCRVVPAGLVSAPSGPALVPQRSCPHTVSAALLRVSDTVQVSFRGAYSVERLYAFEEYCSHASLARVLVVCCLAPLPPLVLALSIELVPLARPDLGWQANFVFFGRSMACAFGVAMALQLQVKNIFPDLELTSRECAKVSLCVAAAMTALFVVVANFWVFPIPFSMTFGSIPFLCVYSAVSVVLIGVQRLTRLSDARNRLRRFTVLLAIQGSLPVMYPAFAILYATLRAPSLQILSIAALSLVKQVLKNLLVRHATVAVHDYVPEIAVFSIDAFHSIYLCACMQVTRATWTQFIVIGVDLVHHVLSWLGIHRRTRTIRELLNLQAPIFHGRSLASILVDLFAQPNGLDPRAFASVRLRSCIHHRLSRQASRVLRRLSISHPSDMPKEDADDKVVITAAPTSLLPIPLLLRRQSTDDLLVLADVLRPTGGRRPTKRTVHPGLRKSAFRSLRIQSQRSLTSSTTTQSTERSGSSRVSSGSLTRQTRVVPVSMGSATPKAASFSPSRPNALVEAAKRHQRLHIFDALSSNVKTQLAHESLSLLFTTEYLALTEYVELLVPILYTLYVPVVVQIPNIQFHTTIFSLAASHDAVATATLRLGTYALMELVTFIGFHYAVAKYLRISALYQVAFVLEHQIEMIEGKLVAWMLFAVQFSLAHCGGFTVDNVQAFSQ